MKTTLERSAATLAAAVTRIYAIVGDGLSGLTGAIRRQGRIGSLYAHEIVRRAAPYFLLAVLPGGFLLAPVLFLQRRRSLGVPHTGVASENDPTCTRNPFKVQNRNASDRHDEAQAPCGTSRRSRSVTSATQFDGCETQPWSDRSQMSTGASSSFDGR